MARSTPAPETEDEIEEVPEAPEVLVGIPLAVVPHNTTSQVSMGGYAKGTYIVKDGATWMSLVNNNLRPPTEDSPFWRLVG